MSWVDSLFTDKVEVQRKDGSICWASQWIPSFETHRGNLGPGDKISEGGSYSRFLYYKPKLEDAILRAYRENGPGRRAEFEIDELLLPKGL